MKKILSIFILSACFIYSEVYADVVILNGLTHEHRGIVGNSFSGRIKMKNIVEKPEKMKIYKNELILFCGQESTFKDTIPHDYSITNWLKTNVNEKVMDGYEEYDVTYEFTIPEGTKAGTYYTILMVESDEAVPSLDSKNKITINTKVRYGVSVIVHVGTFENPIFAFEDVSITKNNDKSQAIRLMLKNNGTYAATAKIVVEIFQNGNKIKTYAEQMGQIGRVYPNKCRKFETIISDLPKGKYDGVVVADNGQDLFGTNITLEIE